MIVTAIASNNLVAAKKDTELFDSAKKLRVANAKTLETKLFRTQKRTIAMNESLLTLYMHKVWILFTYFVFERKQVIFY